MRDEADRAVENATVLRAIDDPVVLARVARIVRAALARRTGGSDRAPAEPRAIPLQRNHGRVEDRSRSSRRAAT